MPPSGNGVIANAVIEVTVDRSKIKAGFDAAAQETRTQSSKIVKATQADTGLLGTAKDIKTFTKPVREFREAIQGTLGAVIGFAGTAGLAIGAVTGLVAGMREFWKWSTSVTTAADRMGNSVNNAVNQGDRLRQRLEAISKENRPKYGLGAEDAEVMFDDKKFDEKRTKQIEEYNRQLNEAVGIRQKLNYEEREAKQRLQYNRDADTRRTVNEQLRQIAIAGLQNEAKILDLKQSLDKPEVVKQREAIATRIKNAEAQDVADEARRIDRDIARKRMSDIEKSYDIERETLAQIEARKVGANEEAVAAYAQVEAAMRRFYAAEREEIARNNQLRVDGAMNAVKQASIDATGRLVTSIENLNQVVLRIEQGMRGLK